MQTQLADYLKQKREAAGLSQRDISDALGYETPQFISNWERGVSQPPVGKIKKLAVLLKISADDLFDVILRENIQQVTKDLRRKFASSKAV